MTSYASRIQAWSSNLVCHSFFAGANEQILRPAVRHSTPKSGSPNQLSKKIWHLCGFWNLHSNQNPAEPSRHPQPTRKPRRTEAAKPQAVALACEKELQQRSAGEARQLAEGAAGGSFGRFSVLRRGASFFERDQKKGEVPFGFPVFFGGEGEEVSFGFPLKPPIKHRHARRIDFLVGLGEAGWGGGVWFGDRGTWLRVGVG